MESKARVLSFFSSVTLQGADICYNLPNHTVSKTLKPTITINALNSKLYMLYIKPDGTL